MRTTLFFAVRFRPDGSIAQVSHGDPDLCPGALLITTNMHDWPICKHTLYGAPTEKETLLSF